MTFCFWCDWQFGVRMFVITCSFCSSNGKKLNDGMKLIIATFVSTNSNIQKITCSAFLLSWSQYIWVLILASFLFAWVPTELLLITVLLIEWILIPDFFKRMFLCFWKKLQVRTKACEGWLHHQETNQDPLAWNNQDPLAWVSCFSPSFVTCSDCEQGLTAFSFLLQITKPILQEAWQGTCNRWWRVWSGGSCFGV